MSELHSRYQRTIPISKLELDEKHRSTLVTTVIIILLIAVFEGCLRKWIFTEQSAQRAIIFLRDPLAIIAYALAVSWRRVRLNSIWISGTLVLFLIMLFTMFAQFIFCSTEQYPILIFYAYRNYILYLPLVAIIIGNFATEDIIRIFKVFLACEIVTAPLMIIQFMVPPDSPLNIGYGSSMETQFENLGLTEGVVRATGLFTSSTANSMFTLMSIVAAIYFYSIKSSISRLYLNISWAAIAVCAIFSGSRGVFYQLIVIVIFAISGLLLARRGSRTIIALVLLCVIFIIVVSLVLIAMPSVFEATLTRFDKASSYKISRGGALGRILWSFTSFLELSGRLPFWGLGEGYGSNAAVTLGVVSPTISLKTIGNDMCSIWA